MKYELPSLIIDKLSRTWEVSDRIFNGRIPYRLVRDTDVDEYGKGLKAFKPEHHIVGQMRMFDGVVYSLDPHDNLLKEKSIKSQPEKEVPSNQGRFFTSEPLAPFK